MTNNDQKNSSGTGGDIAPMGSNMPESGALGFGYYTYDPVTGEVIDFQPAGGDDIIDEDDDDDRGSDRKKEKDGKDGETDEEGAEQVDDPSTAQDMADAEDAQRDAAEIATEAEDAEIAAEAGEVALEAEEAVAAIEAAAAPEEAVGCGAFLFGTPVGWAILAVIAVILIIVVVIIFSMAGSVPGPTGTTPAAPASGTGSTYTAPADVVKYCKYVGSISDAEALKIYGKSESAVASQLVNVKFTQIGNIKVHKKAAPCFEAVSKEIEATGAAKNYKLHLDGTFNWRCNMNEGTPASNCATSMSNHSFGIAIDLNANDNDVGTHLGNMPPAVVKAFEKYGFNWLGSKSGFSDPMHFEWMGRPK